MFDSITEALEALKNGELIIVVDDEDRENEGDLVGIAEYLKPESINFMATYGRGLICTPMDESIARKLELPPMADENSDPHSTAFTVSVDHYTTTTGISAFERFDNIMVLINVKSKKAQLYML